jgi:teichuronic acid biosynthesis glycosyltransferase TuaG|tara:strand:- start:121 stop:864 length:744 start_codon:yes stop_codon:yes gene_type:complete
MDLVSVVIPYFKKREYINKCIQSVLRQNYKNFEIIIIYDDQDYSDLSYLKSIAKKNKRIQLITNSKSLGAGLSRNKGIKIAKGKFIAFLDADDYWDKNKLKFQLKFMKKNNYLVSHTSYQIIDKKDKNISSRVAKNFFRLEDLLYSCDIGLSTMMLKKNIFSKNIRFPNIKTKEDFILWLNILKKKIPIMGYNKKLTYWRKLDNSLSSSTYQKLFDGFKVYYVYMNYSFVKSIFYLFCLSINFLKKN